MRKHRLLILLFALATQGGIQAASNNNCPSTCNVKCLPCVECGCKAVSHTFFFARPLFQIGSPEHESLWRWRIHAREDKCTGGALQLVPFFSRTTNPMNLATFFGPSCKNVFLVSENINEQPDILSFQINVISQGNLSSPDAFKSQISLHPRRTESGLGISYRQGFDVNFCGCERTMWFEINAPITHVTTNLGFCENVINVGNGEIECQVPVPPITKSGTRSCGSGSCSTNSCSSKCTSSGFDTFDTTFNKTVTEALNRPQLECGKIRRCCKMSTTRLSNLDLVIGLESVSRPDAHVESYAGVSLPTGNRVKGDRLFEPVAGQNHHLGFMFGSNVGLKLWCNDDEDRNVWFEANLHGMYLLHNCQHRLVDLKCKPWSRYMRYYSSIEQAQAAFNTNGFTTPCLSTPGTNILCLDLRVHPGFQRSFNTALVFNMCAMQGEVGVNFFARQAECVRLKKPWDKTPALASVATDQRGQWGTTDRVQTINDVFQFRNVDPVENYNDNVITACDLDLESAAHPAYITNTVYGSLGWRFDTCCYPTLFGLGGSYEFGPDNTSLDRFNIWLKFGMSF